MIERHLNGVPDLRNLIVEATDVLIRDVGNLGGQQLLDVLAHDALERDTRAGIHNEGVARTQVSVA